jgi:2-iminoacetate synthase
VLKVDKAAAMLPIASTRQLSQSGYDFICDAYLESLLHGPTDPGRVKEIIAKSLAKEPLTVEETAELLRVQDPELQEAIFAAARELKEKVYGNRIVLFAPLYIGSLCVNDCIYCGFRRSNPQAVRKTLSSEEIQAEVTELLSRGHKRLILVFGEHPRYSPEFIAECVRNVYACSHGYSRIRRVNINAAPLDHEGFRAVKAAGIGTYQIFQETYHHPTYSQMHPPGTRKADYLWRLDSPARAIEAGADDVGIGALFGLYDWRFEVLGLVSHARHLYQHYGIGPHTISFPRLRPASGVPRQWPHQVSDQEFKRLVAILRLSVPYTGLILTAREPAHLRRELLGFGVSQIDGGSRIELGGYSQARSEQQLDEEQFQLADLRSLDEVIYELLRDGYIPSFCTACYRLGRTGQQFMEFAIPGFIRNFCTPNALTTLMEYLVDYASPGTRELGKEVIAREIAQWPENKRKQKLLDYLHRIEQGGERDLYF